MMDVLLLAAAAVAPPPVATVNGAPLARWEAEREFSQRVGSTTFHRNLEPARRVSLRRESLDALVLKELKRQWAASNGVEPEPGVAERSWRTVRDRFPDESSYRDALKQQGITDPAFRAAFAREAAAGAVDRHVRDGIPPPSTAEVEAFFSARRGEYVAQEARHVVHLLVYVPPGSDATVAQRAELEAGGLALKARRGEFDLAAEAALRREQLPPKYRDQVGDLGFVHRGALATELEAPVFAAVPGDVVGPVRTIYGYHLLRVLETRPSRALPLGEVRDAVAARILRERREAALAEFEAALRRDAAVKLSAWPDEP